MSGREKPIVTHLWTGSNQLPDHKGRRMPPTPAQGTLSVFAYTMYRMNERSPFLRFRTPPMQEAKKSQGRPFPEDLSSMVDEKNLGEPLVPYMQIGSSGSRQSNHRQVPSEISLQVWFLATGY